MYTIVISNSNTETAPKKTDPNLKGDLTIQSRFSLSARNLMLISWIKAFSRRA